MKSYGAVDEGRKDKDHDDHNDDEESSWSTCGWSHKKNDNNWQNSGHLWQRAWGLQGRCALQEGLDACINQACCFDAQASLNLVSRSQAAFRPAVAN